MMSSDGNTCEFPAQRPVMQSFDVFFDLRLNKQLNKNPDTDDLRHYCTHNDIIVMNAGHPRECAYGVHFSVHCCD